MKAVTKTRPEPGNVELTDMPGPHPEAGHVVIEVHNAGICGTDIHILKSEYIIEPPVILGHEFCGEIVEVGSEVTGFAVGDRVTVNPSAGKLCGKCRYCRMGAPFFCVDRAALGSGINGGFARYCGVRQEILFKLPDSLDMEAGALSEPFACAFQAVVELTEIRPGEVAVVSGPGPIGLMCMLLARAHGARVVVLGTSVDGQRLDLARQLGADEAMDVETANAQEVIDDLTHGFGADVVLECAGAEGSAAQCLDLVGKLGRYTQVGIFGAPITADLDQVVLKQLRLQGSICHTWQTWERTMDFLGQGTVDLHSLISARLPLSRWQEGFDMVIAKQGAKVLLYPEEG